MAGRGTERAHRLNVGEVELKCRRAPSEDANLALDFTSALLVHSIGDRNVGSGPCGRERNRPANSARSPGDEHGFAGERRA